MTKEEAKLKLRKDGYQVVDDNSVVTVIISADSSLKNTVKDVKSKLSSWGYEASFAVKQHKGELSGEASGEAKEESLDEDISDEEIADISEESAEKEEPKAAPSLKADKKEDTSEEEEFLDDDKEDPLSDIKIDEDDMDMLLSEESIQFSLEDFGMDF